MQTADRNPMGKWVFTARVSGGEVINVLLAGFLCSMMGMDSSVTGSGMTLHGARTTRRKAVVVLVLYLLLVVVVVRYVDKMGVSLLSISTIHFIRTALRLNTCCVL